MMSFMDKNAPLRLLRKAWSSPDELAQELYAMFTAKAPVEVRGPLTIRVAEGQEPIQVVRDEPDRAEGPSYTFGAPGRPVRPPAPGPAFPTSPPPPPPPADDGPQRRISAPALAEPPARRPAALPEPPPRRPIDPPAPPREAGKTTVIDADLDAALRHRPPPPVYFNRAPIPFEDDNFLWKPVPVHLPAPPPSGDSLFWGKVLDGAADSYTVELYAYPGSDVVDTVTVRIWMINPSATLPPGSPLFPVHKAADGNYYAQTPIWLGGF